MPRTAHFFIGVTLIFLLTAGGAKLAAAEALRAVFVTWKPYGYLEDGKAKGFELDIFASVMKRMKMGVVFEERPWKRCLYMVRRGKADLLISIIKTKKREAFLCFPREYISISETALFTTAGRQIDFDGSLESLKGYTIGVTSAFSYGDAFDGADFLIKDENIRPDAIVKKLLMERTELGIGNIAVISLIARKKKSLHRIRFLKPLIHSRKLYVGFSAAKGHEQLAEAFSAALHDFKTTPEYPAILKSYGIKYSSP